jgi:hypothetical protein
MNLLPAISCWPRDEHARLYCRMPLLQLAYQFDNWIGRVVDDKQNFETRIILGQQRSQIVF